jgi:hypothetical protein
MKFSIIISLAGFLLILVLFHFSSLTVEAAHDPVNPNFGHTDYNTCSQYGSLAFCTTGSSTCDATGTYIQYICYCDYTGDTYQYCGTCETFDSSNTCGGTTPPPPIGPPPPPAAPGPFTLSGSASCAAPPATVNLSWSVSSNSIGYDIYGWYQGGSPVFLTTTTSTSVSIPNTNQNAITFYYVVSVSPTYTTTDSNTIQVNTPNCVTPPPPPVSQTPPTVSLSITNAGNTGFGGTTATSGNQAGSDGIGWNNPINVSLGGQAFDGATIKEYYVKFAPGFEAAYTTQSGVLCGSTHCINNGSWIPIDPNGTSVGNIILRPNGPAGWRVFFNSGFGNQNISTSGYTKDTNNNCSISPCGTYQHLNQQ